MDARGGDIRLRFWEFRTRLGVVSDKTGVQCSFRAMPYRHVRRYNWTMSATTTDGMCTPDRRYMVIRGRLWRLSNPFLDPADHERLVSELMSARRAVRAAADPQVRVAARQRVDAAKRALGERGDVWWQDGAPDYNRKPVLDTPYAAWFSASH